MLLASRMEQRAVFEGVDSSISRVSIRALRRVRGSGFQPLQGEYDAAGASLPAQPLQSEYDAAGASLRAQLLQGEYDAAGASFRALFI